MKNQATLRFIKKNVKVRCSNGNVLDFLNIFYKKNLFFFWSRWNFVSRKMLVKRKFNLMLNSVPNFLKVIGRDLIRVYFTN